MTDTELIILYNKGDDSAFNTLMRRYHKPVFNYLLKLTGSREDASDLAQNAFIRCCGSLKKLKDKELFVPWLYKIAANLARDHWRSRKEYMSFDSSDNEVINLNASLVSDDDPFENAAAIDRAAIVRKALLQIPIDQRDVLILKMYQGLKFTEIAEATGDSINTVKSRLYYGLTAMKKILKNWIPEELEKYEM